MEHVKPGFTAEYARYLGYRDGVTLGAKNPNRSFTSEYDQSHNRDTAYAEGLAQGIAVAKSKGLDMTCRVHWDNPGFDTPECGSKATHLDWCHGHVIPVCDRHAAMVATMRQCCDKQPCHAVVPIAWL